MRSKGIPSEVLVASRARGGAVGSFLEELASEKVRGYGAGDLGARAGSAIIPCSVLVMDKGSERIVPGPLFPTQWPRRQKGVLCR